MRRRPLSMHRDNTSSRHRNRRRLHKSKSDAPESSTATVDKLSRRLIVIALTVVVAIATAVLSRTSFGGGSSSTYEAGINAASMKWCPDQHTLERHDFESSHGDVCRESKPKSFDFKCPTGCHRSSDGSNPFCIAEKGNGPCRVSRERWERPFRCDSRGSPERGVCIKAEGPAHEFKGSGHYRDPDCNGSCGASDTSSEKIVQGGGKCKSDWDCSLSGVCNSNSRCECDAWAGGLDCSYLRFDKVDPARLGYLDDINTSWGGNAVLADDGLWHMYVTEIICGEEQNSRRCGLDLWQTKSQVAHVISENVEGPYKRKDVVVPIYAHNPTLQISPSDKSWNLYYISGSEGPIAVKSSTDAGQTWGDAVIVSDKQNPAPLMNVDGSVTLFFRGDKGSLPSPTCSTEYIGRQDCSSRTARCNDISGNPNQPIFGHTAEDPSVFVDSRGNFHMLMNALPYMCVPKHLQGGHAWSRDGVHWSEPRVGSYTSTIELVDGNKLKCERRERPQMVLNPKNGEPLALVSAVVGCPRRGFLGRTAYRGGSDSFTIVQLMATT